MLSEYFPNGFVLNDDGRVAIGTGEIFSVTKVRPVDAADDLSIGTQSKAPSAYSGGQSVDLAGAMLFVDVAGARADFDVHYVGGMPYTEYGALVIDSSNEVHSYVGGVPMTAAGFVAAGLGGATPPPETDCGLYAVVTEGDAYWVTEDGRYVVLSKECHVPVQKVVVLEDGEGTPVTTDAGELLLV
jgi:hypothetical protein